MLVGELRPKTAVDYEHMFDKTLIGSKSVQAGKLTVPRGGGETADSRASGARVRKDVEVRILSAASHGGPDALAEQPSLRHCGFATKKAWEHEESLSGLDCPLGTVRDWHPASYPSIHAERQTDERRPGSLPEVREIRARLRSSRHSYVHLLGLYLGDGCISSHPRGVYRLRIALDMRYPRIVEECAARCRRRALEQGACAADAIQLLLGLRLLEPGHASSPARPRHQAHAADLPCRLATEACIDLAAASSPERTDPVRRLSFHQYRP